MALGLCAIAAPLPASAVGLDCTFTTICSPQTDCQSHEGLPFAFAVIGGAFSFMTPDGPVMGTPLGHVAPPGLAVLFDGRADATVLLSVTASGEAVMTQHDQSASGRLQAVAYYGTCAPAP